MNKEFIVVLLKKDIHELSLLTEGFEKMNTFPEPMLLLAKQKTESILQMLTELGLSAHSELGEIDYQSFDYKSVPEVNVELSSERNDFSAPVETYMEVENEPEILETPISENERTEEYIQTEHDLMHAAGEIDEITENNDEEVVNEVPEIITEPITTETNSQPSVTTEEEIQEAVKIEKPIVNEYVVQQSASLNDTHFRHDTSVSDEIANQKVDDIRQAMNIGDRFRFQRELFGGNGEVMNKTIAYLNQLAKYEEAESFLKSKFGWANDNQHAEEFLQIIKRRY